MKQEQVSSHASSIHEKTNSKVESKLTKSSSSRRKLLEIEVEEVRNSADIEKRKAEIDAEMIRKKAQLRRELLQEYSSKKSTIYSAESIFDMKEMTIQEKVDNWKTEETENNQVPMTNNPLKIGIRFVII
ncbi:hypothetical protein JTB14_023982 [Gonioctena quinquepunctata]|nr:hypothetical protein JTB14_023982 [Gonioctena quinquepunctata]